VPEHAEVVIIGAGAGGAAVASRLAELGARSIVCLEQGDWIDRGRLPKARLDWEARARRLWSPNPNVRRWAADYPVQSVGADPVDVNLYNAVGGSTVGFYGNYWRLSPSDFRRRSLDGVGVDWPISYRDLAPYYDRNERDTGVAGLAGDPMGPPRPAPPCPPAPLGVPGQRLVAGLELLGWHWWPTDQAIVTSAYDGRPACDNRGNCAFGCPQRSLSTADVTYWPRALGLGVELRTRARVRELRPSPDGRVRSIVYYGAAGRVAELSCDVVVLAAGGLGTPRLLLLSDARSRDGLANSSGLVGRNLMIHIQTIAVGTFAERLEGWQGTLGGTVGTRQFYETDPGRGYAGGFIMSGGRGISPLTLASGAAPWGERHHAVVDSLLNHQMGAFACGDDLPEDGNRVELDWAHHDPSGLPGVRVHYAMGRDSRLMADDIRARLAEMLTAAGATAVRDLGFSPLRGWHLLGTARMGTNPENSVVSADHRAHDAANLFIADASVFPTAGGVNPANTVQALALRCADRIWALRREL
jgi:choline dehydrogenase-like flavoprotein